MRFANQKNARLRYSIVAAACLGAGVAFGGVNVSCGAINDVCAQPECGDTTALEERMAALEADFASLESAHASLAEAHDGLSDQLAALDVDLRYARHDVERSENDGTNTIKYTAANGETDLISIGDGTGAVTGRLIAYRPGTTGDATLYFNIEGWTGDGEGPAACTLLQREDDDPRVGLYYATDAGNAVANIWGSEGIRTFILRREGVSGANPIPSNVGYSIACFNRPGR